MLRTRLAGKIIHKQTPLSKESVKEALQDLVGDFLSLEQMRSQIVDTLQYHGLVENDVVEGIKQ